MITFDEVDLKIDSYIRIDFQFLSPSSYGKVISNQEFFFTIKFKFNTITYSIMELRSNRFFTVYLSDIDDVQFRLLIGLLIG
jgi:hypothetical protein